MRVKNMLMMLLAGVILVLGPLQAHAAPASVPVTPSGMPVSGLEDKVDEIMEKHIGTSTPGAAVSIVKDGKIIFTKGYGYADVAKQIPMNADTTYMEAGSVSKLFTWTAVMQLVEQGKLDLDADIREYLPENFLKLSFKEPITLNHLMSHTAGFEERLENLLVDDPARLRPLAEHISPQNQPDQIYPPGKIIAYSNYGTNLAGYIVERVSGMPFDAYIEKHIFEPLDMKKAYFTQRYDLIPDVKENKAVGYLKQGEEWLARPDFFINDMPAGSLNITAENMAHFMIAQMNSDGTSGGSLFSKKETLAWMHERSFGHTPELPGNAHGFWEVFAGNHRVLEHGGNTDAFSALLSIVPEENFGISILTNAGSEMSGARTELVELLVGDTFTSPSSDLTLNHGEEVAGKYRSAREAASSLLKVTSVISDTDTLITANDKGGITLQIPYLNISADYVETAPYFFERADSAKTPMDFADVNIGRLYFLTDDNGKVHQMSYGVIADQLPISFLQTALFSYILVGTCLILFVIGLTIGIVGWVKNAGRRRRGEQTRQSGLHKSILLISVGGLLGMVNLVIAVMKLAGDPFQPMSSFHWNIILNWVLGAAFITLIFYAAKGWRKQGISFFQKTCLVLVTLAYLIFTFFLYTYNFYTFS
ncbi:beta-lactamase family protein [Paenibacillus sp. P96]|uniref:Beta-lactamase family protein n=1 Tax=Paenibacillus zeirhizosphaerae TaxID=2987519 RepID=A0ABT9FTJ9_9BACL|nr:serine hydrolase domain-containing protein [Paenibacillus sp. P96]MDP4097782.1 beta-lactamase family protein [Paenibacillus sp. P96]